ncbi:hypothetical protein PENANT_c027G03855 [Penicillium antarcticum]|uniref:Xylose isomerase-like TIM barrel domain-containing protein n=1 Tax=Penicillium antarcticum TaxID=416450 RepID=A0A1V6PXI8_9EURO|nr:uncharacterized protein N7508_003204 [Penicillium antarcticum]KAJ5312374.1 hypothetical protein N7508_003204 [Penicillium antarcticum]OQD81422.1 hypothetical protein PENANT_c027G03855 [Penicillium antarcticum]
MTYQPAIMSVSLRRAWLQGFDYRISQAANTGFQVIEVFYEDLEYTARDIPGKDTPTADQLFQVADHIHSVCQPQGLEIIGLQQLLLYERPRDREQHAKLIKKMVSWLQIVKRLHTTTIQILANFLSADQLTDDFDIIAADLRQVAAMAVAETPFVCFAYENLFWSTHLDTREKLWTVVKRVG